MFLRRSRVTLALATGASLLALASCQGLLDFTPRLSPSASDAAATDASMDDVGSDVAGDTAAEAAADAGPCPRSCGPLACVDGGCEVRTLIADATGAASLFVNGDLLYWVTKGSPGQVMRCTLPTCAAPEVLIAAADLPTAVAVQGNRMFWIERARLAIRFDPDVNASDDSGPGDYDIYSGPVDIPTELAFVDTDLFAAFDVTGSGTVRKCISNCNPIINTYEPAPARWLHGGPTGIAWVAGDAIRVCPGSNCVSTAVVPVVNDADGISAFAAGPWGYLWARRAGDGGLRLLDTAGNTSVVVPNLQGINALRVNGSFVYYATPSSREIARVPLAGGAPEVLAQAGFVESLWVSNEYVVWIDALANAISLTVK